MSVYLTVETHKEKVAEFEVGIKYLYDDELINL